MTTFLALRDAEIVGVYFRPPEVKALVKTLEEGTTLQLRREPENQYDNLAVAVDLDGTHIGYIPKAINPLISMFLANGYTSSVVITKAHASKPLIKVELTQP